jgi:hypothetical protein
MVRERGTFDGMICRERKGGREGGREGETEMKNLFFVFFFFFLFFYREREREGGLRKFVKAVGVLRETTFIYCNLISFNLTS